jgi:hypothetical protein
MGIDKRLLLQQLRQQYVDRMASARRAELDARDAAKTVATESEKKEDARVALELGSLANGQALRSRAAREEIDAIDALCLRPLPALGRQSPVGLMALVDVAMVPDEGDEEERTFLVLPLGAGAELSGPGGDGFLSVITPSSPVGRALIGKRAGDSVVVDLPSGGWELRILDVS